MAAKDSILACALEVAELASIPRAEREQNLTWKSNQLALLAELVAATGDPEGAWKLVERLGEPARVAPPAMAGMAVASIRAGDAAAAQRAIDELSRLHEWTVSPAMSRIAREYVRAGRLEDALAMAEKIPDAEARGRALLALAEEPRLATRALRLARAAADVIPQGSHPILGWEGREGWTAEILDHRARLELMVEIVRAWVKRGEMQEADRVCSALADVDDPQRPLWQARSHLAVARGHLESKAADRAATSAEAASQSISALSIEVVGDLVSKVGVLAEIAELRGELGQADVAIEIADQARDVAKSAELIDEPSIRASTANQVEARVAATYLRLGQPSRALDLLATARKLAEETVIPPGPVSPGGYDAHSAALRQQAEGLARVAALLEEVGEREAAADGLTRALSLARSIPDEYWRRIAWRGITDEYLELGAPERALEILLLESATGVAVGLEDALSSVARAFLDSGALERARQVARVMPPCFAKVELLVELATKVEEEAEREYIAEALSAIRTGFAEWEDALLWLATTYPGAGRPVGPRTAEILTGIAELARR